MTQPLPLRILYFEDDLLLVRLLTRILAGQPGVVVDHVGEGGNAVNVVTDRRPDLVFLDLHLPDCSGEDVLRQLQESPVTRGTPVVVLSADATSGLPERLKEMGASGFLTKPLNFAEVLAAVGGTRERAQTGEGS